MERIFNLMKILNDTGGLLGVKSKVKVRNIDHLSYVYSPGVGACCMAIKDDVNQSDNLTNRMNSVLVLTDSSGFKGYNPENWVQEQTIPYLESKAFYYKVCCGLDSYPLLFDHQLTTGAKDLHVTLDSLAIAYRGIHLVGVSDERVNQLKEMVVAQPISAFFVSDQETRFIKSYLDENHLSRNVSVNQVVSCLLRVAVDCRVYGFVSQELLFQALEGFRKANDPLNHDLIATMHLVRQLVRAFKVPIKQRFRKSAEYVKTYRLFRGERRPKEDHDFTNTSVNDNSIYLHNRFKGVVETYPRMNITNLRDIDVILADKCLQEVQDVIAETSDLADFLTLRRNYSAIITNGTAVLGFGNIGPEAAMPVMEGKAVLFKEFGRVNVMPIGLKPIDSDEFILMVRRISPIFCSINLEDIKGPSCFKIERTLAEVCRPAIFHDDQHGTAIIVVSALINSLRLLGKDVASIKIVINGAGAAGISICKLLHLNGSNNIIICDSRGAIYEGRPNGMNPQKEEVAKFTNRDKIEGKLADVIQGADFFIGVSVAGALSQDMIKSMADKPVVMALANPVPEIMPKEAKEAGAYIICTGRSDYPNQVNNSLAFPGIFRAIFSHRIESVTDEMKLAASRGIAKMVNDEKLTPESVIPFSLDSDVPRMVSDIMSSEAERQKLLRPKPSTENFCLMRNRLVLEEGDDV